MLKAFFKDMNADSDFLNIQNNMQGFFTKVLRQEAQVGVGPHPHRIISHKNLTNQQC